MLPLGGGVGAVGVAGLFGVFPGDEQGPQTCTQPQC